MPRPTLVGQNGEDHLLLAALGDMSDGFFIDVGAFDGVHLSNTWVFEQLGWTGYCLEPSPKIHRLLMHNRPRSLCLQVAASSEVGAAKLFTDPTMLLSSASGDEQQVRENYERAAADRALSSKQFGHITVPTTTLNAILRKHAPLPRIDLLSIDVEGMEMQVLDGFDLAFHRPRVLVIEANDDAARAAVHERCQGAGYTHCRTLGNNHFFAHEEQLVRQLQTTRMNCFTPRNLHPFGRDYTHPTQRQDRVLLRGQSYTLADLVAEAGRRAPSPDSGEATQPTSTGKDL